MTWKPRAEAPVLLGKQDPVWEGMRVKVYWDGRGGAFKKIYFFNKTGGAQEPDVTAGHKVGM